MNDGVFVTGTDTGVGKTVVSACLLAALCRNHRSAMYMKPVQTGCVGTAEAPRAPDVDYVLSHTGRPLSPALEAFVCPYRFRLPASPHLAAEQEGTVIDLTRLREAYATLCRQYDTVIVEGAGGVLVPLNRRETMLDLMTALKLPVVVVCRSGLGTLNHTMLTVRTLRSAGLTVAGIVMVHTAAGDIGLVEKDNQRTLQELAGAPFWGCVPFDAATAQGRVNRPFIEQTSANLLLPAPFSL